MVYTNCNTEKRTYKHLSYEERVIIELILKTKNHVILLYVASI